MHILVIPSWYPSGVSQLSGIFIKEQVEALLGRGHQIGVLSPIFSKHDFPEIHESDPDQANIFIQARVRNPLPFLFGSSGYFWVQKGYQMYKAYVESCGTPEIIHAHSSLYAGVLAEKIHKKHGVSYVLTEHSSFVTRKKLPFWNVPRVRRAFKSAAFNLAVSNFSRDEILQKYDQNTERWGVIPNMVGSQFFKSETKTLDGKTFIFTNIGSLVDVKAQDILLRATAILRNSNSIKLNIVGDGYRKQDLIRLAEELGVENEIEWIHQADSQQIVEIIANSHAVVSSSTTETFGLTLAESLAVGRPVVSTNSGGPSDIIDERVGLIVKKGNPESLAEGMGKMIKNWNNYSPDQLKKIAREKFHEDIIMTQLESIYQKSLTAKV